MSILVTGGSGFLGQAICKLLRARGLAVRSLARRRVLALDALGVEQIEGDIASLDTVMQASTGIETVFHVAAKAGAWGRFEDYYAINVIGTGNVLAACELAGVGRLIYTSTPSVVHAGGDLEGVDESTPIASHFRAHYPRTKALAEQRVLAANGAQLATLALRPHLIWGPGDNHLLPRIVARARAGRLRFIGARSKPIDTIYIDNAAQAHLDAYDRLATDAACAGRAYFVSQGQPLPLDEMINKLLKAVGLPPETRRIPFGLAFAAGAVLEAIYGLLRIQAEPPMTRFIAEQLATAHWYDIAAARRDLGYEPRVTLAEGLVRLNEWALRGGRATLGLTTGAR